MFQTVLWIGSEKEINEWLPQDAIAVDLNKINFLTENFYRCNIYVHQAKIQPLVDKSDLNNLKLLGLINGACEGTKVR
jgi:hypothetical protein